MDYPVISGVSYILVHAPDIMEEYGTTQTMERRKGETSEYLRQFRSHMRDYREVLAYPPNQVFIGNMRPEELLEIERPWFKHQVENARRIGTFGEIMPQDEFYGLMAIADTFDLVWLEEEFHGKVKEALRGSPIVTDEFLRFIGDGKNREMVEKEIREHHAEPLKLNGEVIGCVRRAHEIDENLSAHVMLENIVSKASAALALKHLIHNTGISPDTIEYIIECSEEAAGDMNQRGGGNFAKSIGEVTGCRNATGSDVRAFCAGPAHAIIQAAGLVRSGIYKTVAVVAGGSVAKLGMNGKDHVAKGQPLLEDVLGGFAVLIQENDGKNPVIRTDIIGRHKISSGASPQSVIQSLIVDPLDGAGLKLTEVDKYSVELHIPEITEPAGAGNIPDANYKMIAAMAVKRGEIGREELNKFIQEHGMPGFASTQGHIPSGVPYIGFARDEINNNEIERVMIIGKGSLFLGRLTNLFDGTSFIIEKNPGRTGPQAQMNTAQVREILAEAMRQVAEKIVSGTGKREG